MVIANNIACNEEDNEDIVVRGIGTNPIQEMRIDKGIPPTYPLQWFEANNWNKPPITLPQPREGARIHDYYHVITNTYRRESVPVNPAMTFLNMLCHVTQARLRFDWISLRTLIGYEGHLGCYSIEYVQTEIYKNKHQYRLQPGNYLWRFPIWLSSLDPRRIPRARSDESDLHW